MATLVMAPRFATRAVSARDRQSVVEGQRVNLGGRRLITTQRVRAQIRWRPTAQPVTTTTFAPRATVAKRESVSLAGRCSPTTTTLAPWIRATRRLAYCTRRLLQARRAVTAMRATAPKFATRAVSA